jgi:propionate CoA-transferase
VFRVEPAGLALIEVADGIDVRRDVLEQMEFAPARIAEPLEKMDATLFAA